MSDTARPAGCCKHRAPIAAGTMASGAGITLQGSPNAHRTSLRHARPQGSSQGSPGGGNAFDVLSRAGPSITMASLQASTPQVHPTQCAAQLHGSLPCAPGRRVASTSLDSSTRFGGGANQIRCHRRVSGHAAATTPPGAAPAVPCQHCHFMVTTQNHCVCHSAQTVMSSRRRRWNWTSCRTTCCQTSCIRFRR